MSHPRNKQPPGFAWETKHCRFPAAGNRSLHGQVADREHLAVGTIDAICGAQETGAMNTTTYTTQRRSTRVFHRVRVRAEGRGHDGKKFNERCETVVVNAHGGLLMMKHEVDNGEMIVLTNPDTQEELECRIVYLGAPSDRGQRVGVEFLTPAPHFWGVEFEDQPNSGSSGSSSIH
jgi:hypothetical protein